MYHYETLGDEKFQELCQALIIADFPTAQCLPVGQPDGGRDAYLRQHLIGRVAGSSDLVVFQVKYSKEPRGNRSERDAITDVVRAEKHKVEKLKSLGLRKYVLLTNVQGTAHLNAGSIDSVNQELSTLLGIEAYCWWRDDLDRRLDAASTIKWSYPEILKATDLLEVLVRGQLGDEEERRRNAIRAYLTAQYDDDLELKFKQTDLRSTMTDLFVDLPMSENPLDNQEEFLSIHRAPRQSYRNKTNYSWYQRNARHAAEFILEARPYHRYSRILLEGAPGQGKSTVTQYVCQVLRMLMLDKREELNKLGKPLGAFMARLPLRVDLRDLAKWLGGTDPFQSKMVPLDDREPKSLEGFLAAQVRHASGGASFNVSDLLAVAKAGHLLLALDGFDEVADVAMRNTLVTEISKATSRLMNAGNFSIQTIVTSRPAAFAKSVRFPRDQWSYFLLLPLERNHVDAYTDKWMRAKALKPTERHTLVRVLNEKLEETHTQYLAKNPMQLTILLSLINSRGSSLPEKRTAMYDAYMDMFFSRESEKSDIVRDNRDLLIDIHRHLAWKLQTAAESGGDGSIEHSELRAALFTYLDSQGEDTTIINALFDGVIERVGALVSRVQETYEFEVQPLREYFAARHLYETAPYSGVADELRGTKLDRFQALVRNPYWLNVARFYGGCFSKGEVSALVDELALIANDGDYKLTSHPRVVALMFLADWVFTQYQPAVKRIVELICQKPHFRQLLAAEQSGVLNWVPLPDRGGKQEFIDRLWEQFVNATHVDERNAIAIALSQSASVQVRTDLWTSLRDRLDESDWISTGVILGLFRGTVDSLRCLLPDPLPVSAVAGFLKAGQFDLLARNDDSYQCAAKLLLGGQYTFATIVHRPPFQKSDLFWMARILNSSQYGMIFTDTTGHSLHHLLETRLSNSAAKSFPMDVPAICDKTKMALEAYQAFLMIPISILQASSAPWSEFVEALRSAWGDCDAIDSIAVIGAGVRDRNNSGVDQSLSSTENLAGVFRHIRMKSGAPSWWIQTLESAKRNANFLRYLLIFWVWSTPRTMFTLAERLDDLICDLSPEEWEQLQRNRNRCQFLEQGGKMIDRIEKPDSQILSKLSGRGSMFFGKRLNNDIRYHVVYSILKDKESSVPELNFALSAIYERMREDFNWRPMLSDIKALYARGAVSQFTLRRDDLGMPAGVASDVLGSLEDYPLAIIASADNLLKAQIGERAPKLWDVAQKEGWFR